MADAKSHSTKDLLLLLVGLYKLQHPQSASIASAEDYWLNDNKDSLRDSEWNWMWLLSPQAAWESVVHRDWLIAQILSNLAGQKQEFGALSEPLLASIDLLSKEFKPRMGHSTDAIDRLVVSKSGYERSFHTTLSISLSRQKTKDKHDKDKEVFVVGAGIRRRTGVWSKGVDERTALRGDVEFLVPFYVVPATSQSSDDSFPGARSLCGGIVLTRANGNRLLDEEDIAAVRFNFRIPFTARMSQIYRRDDYEMVTQFDTPVIKAEKRDWVISGANQAEWEEFKDWKGFVKKVCASKDGKELLNAPIGPILLETMNDESSIKDILKSKRPKVKEDFTKVKDELKETATLLHGLWKDWKRPDENPEHGSPSAPSSERKFGSLLVALGLLENDDGKYKLGVPADLQVWDVVHRLLAELDGFPLYVSGIDPKKEKSTSIVVALASQKDLIDTKKHYFGLAGIISNIPIKTVSEKDPAAKDPEPDATRLVVEDETFTDDDWVLVGEDEEGDDTPPAEPETEESNKKKSSVEIYLHLGKWFDGETLDNNWFRRLLPGGEGSEESPWKRRVPLPGIRLLPFQRVQEDNREAKYSLALRGDLLSAGIDIKGTTKDGLTFLQLNKGPLAYFGLGKVEARIALLLSADRIAFGLAVKLSDLRLSFGPKEKKKDDKKDDEKGSGNDILDGLEDLLADDWVVVPPTEKPKEKKPRTRLSAKKKDKFSISVGYLSPLSPGSSGTLDIQLYDEKGNAGKMVWIPIERRYRAVYLKQIGIGLKGVENVELSEGLGEDAQLTVALTGGLRFPIFELGFIGAKLSFPLREPRAAQFSLDGLDVSLKVGPAVISGSFLKSGVEYAGSLTIDLPKFSIGAMGFYGNLIVCSPKSDKDIRSALKAGIIHQKLIKELADNDIRLNPIKPATRGFSIGEWDLVTDDDKHYTLVEADGELHVLSDEKTLFIYGAVSAATGGGIRVGPIEFTGIALGFGINRRVKVPPIEKVAEFPLVQMVMGEGGYQKDDTSGDIRRQLGEAVDDPVNVLTEMADALPAEQGQHFICGGVRFTIASTVNCFGLIIVQWGNDFEFALLGLARFRHPRDLSAKPICYIEMQILMSVKPSDGCFKLQALLTDNSWLINKDCKLTGGFALYVWFSGDHKSDFVITLGGYHPRFRRPEHYPEVPRLGLNWRVNKNLSIKGGVYYAITPSCCMLGSRLEATFQSGRVSAWFTAYLDVILAWSPFHFEVDVGISLRVEVAFVTTLKVEISASVQIWGPPTGGIAHIELTVISFDIPFGRPRDEAKLELIESWAKFASTFLNAPKADEEVTDRPVAASPMTRPSLTSGRNNLDKLPDTQREQTNQSRENLTWKVRGDELELAASAAVPVTTLNVGRVKSNSPVAGVQERSLTGQSLLVKKPVELVTDGLYSKKYDDALGVHPMGKKLESVLNVAIVRDDAPQPIDLKGWVIEPEFSSVPAALWDSAKPKLKGPKEPSAKLVPDCITGLKRLKPPPGELGQQAELSTVEWRSLGDIHVPKSGASQQAPSGTRSRNIQAEVASKQAKQKRMADALALIGFNLDWPPPQTEIRFRELQADPLVVTSSTSA